MKKRYLIPLLVVAALPIGLYLSLKLPVFGGHPSDNDRLSYGSSTAYNQSKGTFENRRPGRMERMGAESSTWDMLQEWFSERDNASPAAMMPEQRPDINAFMKPDRHTKLIWLGHSSFLLNIDGVIILVDPVFAGYAAPLSFMVKRFQPAVLSLEALPKIDLILLSHDHYDHLDQQTIEFFADKQTQFLAPLGVGVHLHRWGIDQHRIIEKDWWQSHDVGSITFTAAPAQHFSGRDGINNNETLWASWIITSAQSRLYFSGDSGYDTHFKEIGERFGPFDLSIMENGQYDEAWPVVHLFPEETIQAHKELNAKRLMPVHWGMFELAFHAWNEPVERLSRLADSEGVELVTPMLGQTITVGDSIETMRWWQD